MAALRTIATGIGQRVRTSRVARTLKAAGTKFTGYHFGTVWCAWVGVIVLILNTSVTLWASLTFGNDDWVGTLKKSMQEDLDAGILAPSHNQCF